MFLTNTNSIFQAIDITIIIANICTIFPIQFVIIISLLVPGNLILGQVAGQETIQPTCACNESNALCFGLPSVCLFDETVECSLLVQITRQDKINLPASSLSVNLCSSKAKQDTWYGFALSEDPIMGEDFLVHCDVHHNMTLSIGEGLTTGHSGVAHLPTGTLTVPKQQAANSNWQQESGSFVSLLENKLECSWNLLLAGEARGRSFNLSAKPYHLLLAYGRLTGEGSIDYHKERVASPNPVNLLHTTGLVQAGKPTSWLVKFHAFFMIFGWMIMISISITLARNCRDSWDNVQFWTLPLWLFTHRILNMIAAGSALLGLLLIFIHVGPCFTCSCHTIAGSLANSLMIGQLIAGLLRPKSDGTLIRKLFNVGHAFGGHVAFISALTALYLAGDGTHLRLGSAYHWLISLFIIGHFLTQIVLQTSQMYIKSMNAVQDIPSPPTTIINSITTNGNDTNGKTKTRTSPSPPPSYGNTLDVDYVRDKIDAFKGTTIFLVYIPFVTIISIVTYIVAIVTAESY